MNAPFSNIFLAIQQRIQDQVAGIKYIDQDLGQLKSGIRPPVSWPCVLVDFEDFSFSNISENVQVARGTVVLTLAFAPRSSSAQATPLTYLKQAINYYELEWDLHRAVQGWSPGDDYGALVRTEVTTQKRADSYRVREIRYSITYEDYSTQHVQQYAPAVIVVDEQITL